jgi:hypothetical protein
VIDANGIIRHIEQGSTAINPETAVSVCLTLHSANKK